MKVELRTKPGLVPAARAASVEGMPEYWLDSRRPLAALVFLAPLLLIYEVGVLWLGGPDPGAIRNGADCWIRYGFEQIGLDQAWLPPALIVSGLLLWHRYAGDTWRISGETLVGMLAESLLFAFFLVVIGQMTDFVFQSLGSPTLSVGPSAAARAITFVGAGIYEELLFRLCLLPACFGLFRLTGTSTNWAAVLAVLTTSLTFSMAHYVGPAADEMRLFSFTFRTLAGAFFATLFCLRGFGITVGCHAAYDLLVGVLLAARGA